MYLVSKIFTIIALINFKNAQRQTNLITTNVAMDITADMLELIALFFKDVKFIGIIKMEENNSISSEILTHLSCNEKTTIAVFDYRNGTSSEDLTIENTLSNYIIIGLDEALIVDLISNQLYLPSNHKKPSIIIIFDKLFGNIETLAGLARNIGNQLEIFHFCIITGNKLATFDPVLDLVRWINLDFIPVNTIELGDLKVQINNLHGTVLKIFKFDTFDYIYRFTELDELFCKTLAQYLNFTVAYKTFPENESKILAKKFHVQYFLEGKNLNRCIS